MSILRTVDVTSEWLPMPFFTLQHNEFYGMEMIYLFILWWTVQNPIAARGHGRCRLMLTRMANVFCTMASPLLINQFQLTTILLLLDSQYTAAKASFHSILLKSNMFSLYHMVSPSVSATTAELFILFSPHSLFGKGGNWRCLFTL